MSYIPYRDNPDAGGRLTPSQQQVIDEIADRIDDRAAIGRHDDECGCLDPDCLLLDDYLKWVKVPTHEVLAWLTVKGLLDLDLARETAVFNEQESK